MSDIEKRIENLERELGVIEEKEPTTLAEFLDQFPDYKELIEYVSPEVVELLRKYGGDNDRENNKVYKVAEEKLLNRVRKCQEFYSKLHPDGIAQERRTKELFRRYAGGE